MNNFLPRFIALPAIAFASIGFTYAQSSHKNNVPLPENAGINLQWQHADAENDTLVGVSSARAYSKLLNDKKSSPIIVAVIDSGTESFHPDLEANIWLNADEVADNGIDDDKNGYVDDVHGWSFIGGANGDVEQDNLEFTREYKILRERFRLKHVDNITAEEKADYNRYLKMKADFEKRVADAEAEQKNVEAFINAYEKADKAMTERFKSPNYTLEQVRSLSPESQLEGAYKQIVITVLENDLKADLKDWVKHSENSLKYSYNLDFDPRSIVGDNYADPKERIYGNNHINGPAAEHGTHVAGIIGAIRGNGGMDGICPNVQLMIIRCVPDGDERDKDVANAIRYAADNGAKIINMSFGKSLSPNKDVVDEAVKYAESKGVLLIHAAGNDSKNLDGASNFPNKRYQSGGECATWIEVGASGRKPERLAADFSNYGQKSVDVFAPGVDIYSTMTNDTFKKESGTSMASPVTAGVAAALWSYFPELTAKDVKAILLQSSVKYGKKKVPMPGNAKKKVKFKKLSVTGGVVNLYEAVKLAQTWKPGSAQ